MARAKYGPASRARRKKVSKLAKGQRAGRSKWHRNAMESVNKAMAYATRDRRAKKRDFRRLWILRISNACKELGISYSRFIKSLADSKVKLNRKVLSDIAASDKGAFRKLVESIGSK
ncbi:MAG: 50S ribosomal protein L20 [Candidatus Omnitrophota bacterium]